MPLALETTETDDASSARGARRSPRGRWAGARPVRLGLVGLDSSHADQVVDLVARGRLGPEVRLTVLGSPSSPWAGAPDPGRAAHLAQASRPPARTVEGSPEEVARSALGEVDAVVVADRDGRAHARHALPFLRAGVPVLVDKPFTLDAVEAHALVETAERAGVLLTSYSPLRWQPAVRAVAARVLPLEGPATVVARGPVVEGSASGGLGFYAVHAVEVALSVARGPLLEVRRTEPAAPGLVQRVAGAPGAAGTAEPGRTVVLELVTRRDVATVVLEPTTGGAQVPFSVSAEEGGRRWESTVPLGEEYLLPGLEVFCGAVRSGRWPVSPRALVDVVRALEALR